MFSVLALELHQLDDVVLPLTQDPLRTQEANLCSIPRLTVRVFMPKICWSRKNAICPLSEVLARLRCRSCSAGQGDGGGAGCVEKPFAACWVHAVKQGVPHQLEVPLAHGQALGVDDRQPTAPHRRGIVGGRSWHGPGAGRLAC